MPAKNPDAVATNRTPNAASQSSPEIDCICSVQAPIAFLLFAPTAGMVRRSLARIRQAVLSGEGPGKDVFIPACRAQAQHAARPENPVGAPLLEFGLRNYERSPAEAGIPTLTRAADHHHPHEV